MKIEIIQSGHNNPVAEFFLSSSTPETDKFKIKLKTACGEKYWVPVEISEKLEKEKNEFAKLANDLQNQVYYYQMQPYKIECEKNKIIEELEFYKEQLKEHERVKNEP